MARQLRNLRPKTVRLDTNAFVFPQEDTWKSDGRGNFKIILMKSLRSESSPVVVEASGYPLTEEMIQRALQLAQILAGADFSRSDAASLRADLIAHFKKEPATQMKGYESFAKLLQKVPPSSFDGKRDRGEWPCFATTCGSGTAKTRRIFASSRAILLAKWF
jgi:hypothetical protein